MALLLAAPPALGSATTGRPPSVLVLPGMLDDLADNSALDLGEYACTTYPGDQGCARVTEYSGFTYDPLGQQMLLFGGGHSTTFRDDVDVFDLATLTWQSAYQTTLCADMTVANFDSTEGKWISTGHPTSRHSYDLLVVPESTGELVVLRSGDGPGSQCSGFSTGGGRIAHYQIGTDPAVWTFGGDFVWTPPDFYPAAEYDPISGRIVVAGIYGLSTYDPVARIAVKHIDDVDEGRGYANNLVYFPPNQKIYLIARGSPTRIFEVTLDRSEWSNPTILEVTGMTGTVPDSQESGWAYDTVNEIIGGGIRDNVFYAFDPITSHWESRDIEVISATETSVETLAFHAIDYAPGANAFIFLSTTTGGGADRTWAYRYAGASLFGDGFETGDTSAWSVAVANRGSAFRSAGD
jgi:hypothetical protein